MSEIAHFCPGPSLKAVSESTYNRSEFSQDDIDRGHAGVQLIQLPRSPQLSLKSLVQSPKLRKLVSTWV